MPRKTMIGTVVSDKMEKTAMVLVDRSKRHPRYEKLIRKSKKFMADNDLGAKVGERVKIEETRPLSKRKRWRVVEIIK